MLTTKKNVFVSNVGTAGPYVMTPVDYVGEIEEFLKSKEIVFNTDHNAVKMEGVPAFKVINISPQCSENLVSEIRDFLDLKQFTWDIVNP